MQFEHFNICAPSALLEQAKAFYTEVFSLEVGFRPNFDDQGYWLYQGKQPIIHLSQREERKGYKAPGFLDHLACRQQGIEPFTAKLKALDIEFNIKQVPQLDMQQVFLHDPAGIKLEVNFVGEKSPSI